LFAPVFSSFVVVRPFFSLFLYFAFLLIVFFALPRSQKDQSPHSCYYKCISFDLDLPTLRIKQKQQQQPKEIKSTHQQTETQQTSERKRDTTTK
jgi:hypothetical protein